jgi:hypothetical protein
MGEVDIFFIVNAFLYGAYWRQVRKFKRRVGYYPNIAAPTKYHEMMFWRRIFDHNPLFVTFCDKLATKEYVKSIVPEAELPETLWVGRDVGEIPESLRNSDAVLKANHGSSFNHFGGVGGRESKELRRKTKEWLRTDYGRSKHEWGYFQARRLLFLERCLQCPDGEKLVDVSVRCSNGKAILASAATDNKTAAKRFGYFDVDGNRCPHYETKESEDEKLPPDFVLPESFPLAVEWAKRLSVGVDYARYDFLCAGAMIYPGEITVYPGAGLSSADEDGIDALIVEEWDVGTSWFLRTSRSGWRKIYAQAVFEHFERRKRRVPAP